MSLIFFVGRILFGSFFIKNGYQHFKNVESMQKYAGAKGVPHPKLAVLGSGVLLWIGGLSMLTGLWPGFGLLALVAFLGPVTYMMHPYWKESDPMMKATQSVQFWKNLALIGAVLMITMIQAPWPYSL
jgi:putative oxidoreductase